MNKQNLCQSSEIKDDKIENVSAVLFLWCSKVAQSLQDQVPPCKIYHVEVRRKEKIGVWLQTCKHEVQHVTFCSVVFGDFVLFFFFFSPTDSILCYSLQLSPSLCLNSVVLLFPNSALAITILSPQLATCLGISPFLYLPKTVPKMSVCRLIQLLSHQMLIRGAIKKPSTLTCQLNRSGQEQDSSFSGHLSTTPAQKIMDPIPHHPLGKDHHWVI